jgi:hypothetical protein
MKENMNKPTITIVLLDRLEELGFTNEFFDIVHHFNGESIESHRKYCANHTGVFKAGGTNEQVQKRLHIILNSYVSGGFTNPDVFRYLAHASVVEIPYDG